MKRSARVTALIVASAVLSAEKGLPLRQGQAFKFTSAPGAPNLVEMLSRYDEPAYDWRTTRGA